MHQNRIHRRRQAMPTDFSGVVVYIDCYDLRAGGSPAFFVLTVRDSRVRGLRGIWVSGGEAEGLHFVGVLSFGDEFREDGAFGGIQEKFGEALA